MNGIPSTPSQKSIDVWRSAPTIVMWWTPWLWSFRMRLSFLVLYESGLVFASWQAAPRDELDGGLHGQYLTQTGRDAVGERRVNGGSVRQARR